MEPNTDSQQLQRAPDVPRPPILGGSTRAILGNMDAKLERLFIHDQQHVALLKRLNDQFLVLETRAQLAEEKLEKLEAEKSTHVAWRTKLAGVWVGATLTVTAVASIVALIKTFLK